MIVCCVRVQQVLCCCVQLRPLCRNFRVLFCFAGIAGPCFEVGGVKEALGFLGVGDCVACCGGAF
jgi:hypothetical protein